MTGSTSPHNRQRPLRLLKGPLWIADLLYIFDCKTISALRETVGKYSHGAHFFDESKLYYRYHRGEILPGEREVMYWLELCTQAARIDRLSLWEVIGPQRVYTREHLALTLRRLAPNIKSILDKGSKGDFLGPDGSLFLPERTALAPLVRTCSIDALTILLALIDYFRQNPYGGSAISRLIPFAAELFLRLSVFPPFQHVRQQFSRHISEDFFQGLNEDGLPTIEYWEEFEIMAFSDEMIRCLKGMGRLGLVGKTRAEQIKFVNWFREKTNLEIREAACRLSRSDQPVPLKPTDPLYRALRHLHRPSTRSNLPIQLPWKGCYVDDFEIAYAFDKPIVDWERCKEGREASVM